MPIEAPLMSMAARAVAASTAPASPAISIAARASLCPTPRAASSAWASTSTASELKPGDLVFFHTVTPGISHVGMYVGNGHFVHASSRRSGGVRVDNLDSGYYTSAYRGARRMR